MNLFKCSIGKNGLKSKKIEGDNCTPKVFLRLGKVYYRPDRIDKPNTKLKIKKLQKIWVGVMIHIIKIIIKKLS